MSRCLRCGAIAHGSICPSCVDYLVAYCPLWLDPALLAGPSLLDVLGSRDVALLSASDGSLEWLSPPREPTDHDAARLVDLLDLASESHPVVSVGDAAVLHSFLGRARRGLVSDQGVRPALATLYRFLSTRSWMPIHLAEEYRLRARALEPTPPPAPPEEPTESRLEGIEPTTAQVQPEGPAAPTEPVPGPEPIEAQTEPIPEVTETAPPAPPAPDAPDEVHEELRRMEAWVRSQTEVFEMKERDLADREDALEAKATEVQEREALVTDRLIGLEKDDARRDVLQFLGSIPGITEDVANVIATAFPDMGSLEAADAKALLQCRGVTEAVARAIRHRLVPGETEQEERTVQVREDAQAFMEEHNYEAALACYDQLLRERPEDTSLWFDKAELLAQLNRPLEALQSYTRVLDLDRGNRQAWFERANLLFGLGRFTEALENLREGLRLDPSRGSDLILKAEELRRDGKANDAIVLLQAVLDLDPANARAVLAYADCLLTLGDVEASEAFLTRALGKDPRNAEILFRKGEVLRHRGRWGAAIQFYNRSIALRWDYVEPWLAKGRPLLDHGRPAEALECFDRVLSFDSARVEAWLGKAKAHLALAQWEEASRALGEAETRDPESPDLSALQKEAEDKTTPAKDEVPAEFQAFLESLDPARDDVQAILQLGELALEGGDPEMALLRYGEAIDREPHLPDAWVGLGVALQNLERYREALEAYDRALSIDPNHGAARRGRETCARRIEEGTSP